MSTNLAENGGPPTWRTAAERIRSLLATVGISMPHCGPGEEDDCGLDWYHHAVSYNAALCAYAHYCADQITHGDNDTQNLHDQLFGYWSAKFSEDDEDNPPVSPATSVPASPNEPSRSTPPVPQPDPEHAE